MLIRSCTAILACLFSAAVFAEEKNQDTVTLETSVAVRVMREYELENWPTPLVEKVDTWPDFDGGAIPTADLAKQMQRVWIAGYEYAMPKAWRAIRLIAIDGNTNKPSPLTGFRIEYEKAGQRHSIRSKNMAHFEVGDDLKSDAHYFFLGDQAIAVEGELSDISITSENASQPDHLMVLIDRELEHRQASLMGNELRALVVQNKYKAATEKAAAKVGIPADKAQTLFLQASFTLICLSEEHLFERLTSLTKERMAGVNPVTDFENAILVEYWDYMPIIGLRVWRYHAGGRHYYVGTDRLKSERTADSETLRWIFREFDKDGRFLKNGTGTMKIKPGDADPIATIQQLIGRPCDKPLAPAGDDKDVIEDIAPEHPPRPTTKRHTLDELFGRDEKSPPARAEDHPQTRP